MKRIIIGCFLTSLSLLVFACAKAPPIVKATGDFLKKEEKMQLGINFNSLNGNNALPQGYVLKSVDNALMLLNNMKCQFPLARVRTIVFLTEKDPVPTDWLHIPLTDEEINAIQKYVHDNPFPVELAFGALWEADPCLCKGNPFKTIDELYIALRDSLWKSSISVSERWPP